MTYQIKPRGLVSTNLTTKHFFWNIRARKGPKRGGENKNDEFKILPFYPHSLLRAGYAKCYFAHLLYLFIEKFWTLFTCSFQNIDFHSLPINVILGVYFASRFENVKFVDFCGKYRLPFREYLCSPKCSTTPAHSSNENYSASNSSKIRKVLLGWFKNYHQWINFFPMPHI